MARWRGHYLFNTALFGAVFCVVLDRLAKAAALAIWQSQPLPVIRSFLAFTFFKNEDIAFSLPIRINPLYIIIPMIALLAYLMWARIARGVWSQAAALACILCGASSNMYDRIRYGYVIDYIDLRFFTVFNVADILICGGVALLLWDLVYPKTRPHTDKGS